MKIHIVQKGDSLWKIAQKYGVNFEELKKMNSQLSNPDLIMPGMKIKIPTNGVQIKKEFPITKEQPIQKEQPVQKQQASPKQQSNNKSNDMKSAPYVPNTKPTQKPFYPESDVNNNYYTFNMSMSPQEKQKNQAQSPKLPPKPANVLPNMMDTAEEKGKKSQTSPVQEHALKNQQMSQVQGSQYAPNYGYYSPQMMPNNFQSTQVSPAYQPYSNMVNNQPGVAGVQDENMGNNDNSQGQMENIPFSQTQGAYAPQYGMVPPTCYYPVSPVMPGSGFDCYPQTMAAEQEMSNKENEEQSPDMTAPSMNNQMAHATMPMFQEDCGCGGQSMPGQPYQMPFGVPRPMMPAPGPYGIGGMPGQGSPYGYGGGPAQGPYGYGGMPGQDPYGYGGGPAQGPYGYGGMPGQDPYGYGGGPAQGPYGYGGMPGQDPYGYGGMPGQDPYGYGGIPGQGPYGYGGMPSPGPYGYGGMPGQGPYGGMVPEAGGMVPQAERMSQQQQLSNDGTATNPSAMFGTPDYRNEEDDEKDDK
ncbi:SafA/ExsA family spore coat assembly protein [Bacillus carboniphilus]|uniref:SafA/ExsA family spore coat assembly protein n=1 Tax=Bacillus carboniphilus TaxID=86663 RepID=A0ABY9K017_9BACI|nr:SafA/ExsA family spore coat assembly protein [Bacillus carboniphilus]WLR44068.1 SafA/ExsA family spore coat assembly protein [Bacillus carboniphilus]